MAAEEGWATGVGAGVIAEEQMSGLVELARDGDLAAFGRLVERYQDAVFGIAYSMLGDFHDAQDVAQDVFIQAWRGLARLRDVDKFPGWIYRITQNRCKNLLTRSRRDTLPVEEIDRRAATVAAEEPAREPVREAIARLSPPNRLATTLFYLGGYSVAEIGALLGVPQGTVKRRLHDSRKKIRAHLEVELQANLRLRRPSRDGVFMRLVALFNAAAAGDAIRLEALLSGDRALVHSATGEGWSPLHHAARHGHADAVAALLRHGAKPAATDLRWGWTPLHLALAYGHYGAAEQLRAAGAQLDLTAAAALGDVPRVAELVAEAAAAQPAYAGAGPLHWAAYRGQEEVVRLLLRSGADPNARSGNEFDNTALHCAVLNGHAGIAELLLAAGADPWIVDGQGGTPLHALAKYPHEDEAGSDTALLQLLIAYGLDVDAPNEAGETALHWAATRGERRVAGLLLGHGAYLDVFAAAALGKEKELRRLLQAEPLLASRPGPDSMPPLFYAAYGNNPAAAEILLEHGAAIEAPGGWFGGTALHLAAYQGHREMVEFLLARGACAATRDAAGWTPLHQFRFPWWTPQGDRGGIARALLARGAGANAVCDTGDTPLHLAAERGDRRLVELLLRHGARADTRDACGRTPLARAARHAHHQVVHLLAHEKDKED